MPSVTKYWKLYRKCQERNIGRFQWSRLTQQEQSDTPCESKRNQITTPTKLDSASVRFTASMAANATLSRIPPQYWKMLEDTSRYLPPPRSASDTIHLHLHYTINTAIHEPSSIKYNLYCILNNTVQNVTTVYKSPLIFHKNPKKTLLPSIHEIYCKLVENLVMRNILQTSWKSRYEKNMFKYPTKSEKLLVISES